MVHEKHDGLRAQKRPHRGSGRSLLTTHNTRTHNTTTQTKNTQTTTHKQQHTNKNTQTTTTQAVCPQECPLFLCHLSRQLYAVDTGCRQRHGSRSKAAATSQAVPSPRTPERRNGPCRVPAPHLTRSEDGKGRGGGAREARRVTTTEAPSSQGALPVV